MTHYQDFLFVPVPDGVSPSEIISERLLWETETGLAASGRILPPGNWQLLAVSDEVNEEVTKGILQWFELNGAKSYRDYTKPGTHYFIEAINSYQSLLTAAGITYKRFVILKRR